MSRQLSSFRVCGFTALEVMFITGLAGLLISGLVIVVKSNWASVDNGWTVTNATSLNLAMKTYRGHLARGYRPATPWTATDEQEVLLELQKELINGDATVVILSPAAAAAVSLDGLRITQCTPNGVWEAVK